MSQSFPALLRSLQKKHFRTGKAFAVALGVKPSHLSHAMGPGGQPFDVLRCLKLARLTSTHPSKVLRAAGKGEIATLVEELYGPARELSTTERNLLRDYAATRDEHILYSVRTLLEWGAKQGQKGGRKRGGGPAGGGTAGGTGGGTERPGRQTEVMKEPERVHTPVIYQHRAVAKAR